LKNFLILVIVGILILGSLGLSQEAFALTITSINTGIWGDGSTWFGGIAPTGTEDVVIDNGHNVTINQNVLTSGDITINFDGTLIIFTSTFLEVSGNTITNIGNIDLNSTSLGSRLQIDGTVTLTGGGNITMSDSAFNRITGRPLGLPNDTLVNMNNKIQGSGNLGFNQLKIDNQAAGIIEANQPTMLLVDPETSGLTNTGIMRAVGTSTLKLLAGPFTNTNGLIEVNDNSKLFVDVAAIVSGGTVNVNDTAELDLKGTIRDGTLTNTALGTITASGFGGIIGLVNDGTVNILNGASLLFVGPITNNGDININSAGGGAELRIDGTVTLTGGGTITMSNSALSKIKGKSGGFPDDTLVNVDNKIQGSGNFGVSGLKIDNQAAGIIEANQPIAMQVDTSGTTVNSNTGIMRAVGTSTLRLVSGTFTNTNGLIEANDNSKLFVDVAAIVSGGTVNVNDTAELVLKGKIQAVSLTIFGTITINSGGIIINNSGNTIFNFGTITINSGGNITNNSGNTIFNFGTISNSETINNSGNIINCGTYTGNLPSGNMLLSCIISKNITLTSDVTILSGVSMVIDSGAILTINPGVTLTITSGNFIVKNGSEVFIKSGGTLQVNL